MVASKFCAFTGEKLVLFPFNSNKQIDWCLQKATCENSGTSLPTTLPVFLKQTNTYTVYKACGAIKYILCSRLTTKQREGVCVQIHALCPHLLSGSWLLVPAPWEALQLQRQHKQPWTIPTGTANTNTGLHFTEPTRSNPHEGVNAKARYTVQQTQFFASMYVKEFCCQSPFLPNWNPLPAINCNSVPESVTITLLPKPSLQRLDNDEWSSRAQRGPAQGRRRFIPVSARHPLTAPRSHTPAFSTRGDFSPIAPEHLPPPYVLLAGHWLMTLPAVSAGNSPWKTSVSLYLRVLGSHSWQRRSSSFLLPPRLQQKLCSGHFVFLHTIESSKVLAAFLERKEKVDWDRWREGMKMSFLNQWF